MQIWDRLLGDARLGKPHQRKAIKFRTQRGGKGQSSRIHRFLIEGVGKIYQVLNMNSISQILHLHHSHMMTLEKMVA